MFRSLRVRNYRLYASGQLVSLTGTWMQRVAQDWLVLELTNSGTALGIVTALQFGPSLLLGLWGGVLADRGDKRQAAARDPDRRSPWSRCCSACSTSPASLQYWHVLVLATALGLDHRRSTRRCGSRSSSRWSARTTSPTRSASTRRSSTPDASSARPSPVCMITRGRHRLGVRRQRRRRAWPCSPALDDATGELLPGAAGAAREGTAARGRAIRAAAAATCC